LRAALIDVRKAYRLLYLYQRRAMDVAKLVTDEFDHEFFMWSPVHADWPARRLTDPTQRRGWDLLPSYDFSLLYAPAAAVTPKPGSWMLEINVRADSGFPRWSAQEPDPTQFRAPDACETTIGLYGWACTKAGRTDWYKDFWFACDWPEEEKEEVDHPDEGVKIVGRRLPLGDFSDEATVKNVVQEFRSLCQRHFGPAFRV
jgi:hypothetical protein